MEYKHAEHQIKIIISSSQEEDILEQVVEFLYSHFSHYTWVGIYLVEGDDLVLGPWRGPQATEHVRIPLGKGICGSAATSGETEIVGDVSSDDRYLACFRSTRSEIVVPIKKEGNVVGEIDIDSDQPDVFDVNDKQFLEYVAILLAKNLS